MMMLDVRVYYPGKPRAEIDKSLRAAGDSWASGYNHVEDVRDLAFNLVKPGPELTGILTAMPADALVKIRLMKGFVEKE